jgi:hypothetical protein
MPDSPTINRALYEGVEKYGPELIKGAKDIATKINPTLGAKVSSGLDYATSSLSQFAHNAFSFDSVATGKSGALLKEGWGDYQRAIDKHLSLIMQQANATGTSSQMAGGVAERIARRYARNEVFGRDDNILAAMLHAYRIEHGPEKALNMGDILQTMFKESPRQGYNPRTGGVDTKNVTTRFKTNMGKNPLTKDLGFRVSTYQAPGGTERVLGTGMAHILAVKAGMEHMSQISNLMLGSNSWSSFFKSSEALFGQGYKNAQAEMLAHNAIGSALSDANNDIVKFNSGLVKQFAPNSFGEFLSKNFPIPGLSTVRQRLMAMGAVQGRMVAQEAAFNLLKDPNDLVAKTNLKYLGIDFQKVLRNGQLDKEDIGRAMFENVQQRIFFNNEAYRSRFAQNSPIGRMVNMYHNFTIQQSRLLQREMVKAYESKNLLGAAKLITELSLIFPSVGFGIHALKDIWTGKEDPSTAANHLGEHETALLDATNFANRIDGITSVAGFGIVSSYVRASMRRKLTNQMVGPFLGSMGELAEDTAVGIAGKGGEHRWWPVYRDMLRDAPSFGIGSYLASEMFSTQQQINANKPMTTARIRAKRAAELRKARKGE